MGKNRRPGISPSESPGDSSPQTEEETLKDFCSSVPVEEISFEVWCQHHSKLDLQYPISISRAQLQLPLKITVCLSRSIKQGKGDTRVDKREKISHDLIFAPGDVPPKCVVLKGLGDQIDEQVGDLWIIIHIKD